MAHASRWILPSLLACLLAPAWAQQPASGPDAKPAPQRPGTAEDLEPAVNTSAPGQAPAPSTAPAAAAAPAAPAAPEGSSASARATPVSTPAQAGPPGAAAAKPARGGKAMDHLELETTDITGNRELPKVLYIVPWRRPELGDVVGKPVNSLIDEVLQPVDRDVFRRENRYYQALKPGSGAGASGTPGEAGAARNPGGGGP